MKQKHHSTPLADDTKDLGFGSRLSQQTKTRLLNRDGGFNVDREGMSFLRSQSVYHFFLTLSWTKFFLVLVAGYFSANLLFAFAYLLCGPDALHGSIGAPVYGEFFNAFFFSVQTLATIGYGTISPHGLAANILVSIEALVGMLAVTLATGMTFARFSRPSTKILFSRKAVIAPFRGGKAFMFRMINERSNQLINVNASVIFSRMEEHNGRRIRRYYPMKLERNNVMFFPLHWTVVHVISSESPLNGFSAERLSDEEAEVMILISATDETFSATVHARSSYRYDEIAIGAKFRDIFHESNDGKPITVNLQRIHEYVDAELPS